MRFIAVFIGLLTLAGLMPSGESLWIDETSTLQFASLNSFRQLLHALGTSTDSLAQMPLGAMAAWAWVHLGAASEWSLRSLNIAWVLAGLTAMWLTGRRLRLPLLPVWFILQPFLWFYANEFRPYALQIAGATWVLHGLIACLQERGRGSVWAWSLMLGGFAMTGASLLGAIPLALAFLFLAGAFRSWRCMPAHRAWIPLGLGGLLLLLLAGHDAATLIRGAGGARAWELGLLNPLFAGYELLGFLGLGPSRLDIREAARTGLPALLPLFKSTLPAAGMLGLLYLILLMPLKKRIAENRTILLCLAFLTVGTPLLLLAAAGLAGWPFWGRHLSPVLPFTACLTAWLADHFAREFHSRWFARLVPAVLAILLMVSALNLRISPRHRKDDYRRAAAMAVEEARQGAVVWWSADLDTASHYGVPFNQHLDRGGIVYLAAPFNAGTGGLADPAVVFTSKPDLFDSEGRLAAWLQLRNYRVKETLPGFTLWSRP
jgi:hypothetical protein